MASIPQGFQDLKSASGRPKKTFVNLLGVVVDFMVPVRTRGSDWICTFSLADPSYVDSYDYGFRVRYFRLRQQELPAITGKGDVVLLRYIKIEEHQGETIGLSNRGSSWIVFPAAKMSTTMPKPPVQLGYVKEPGTNNPTLLEMAYAVKVFNSCDRESFVVANPTPVSTAGINSSDGSTPNFARTDKFSLIKDVQEKTYCNIVGQVVKIYAHHDRVEVYVSDYTINTLLWNYEWGKEDGFESGREGDEFNHVPRSSSNRKWNGPYGQMTLAVTLWPPHANIGRHRLKENDFVFLRNVHIKWKDRRLEGVLHQDTRHPDREDITVLKDNQDEDRVKEVLRRKLDYAKKFKNHESDMIAQARALKRKAGDDSTPLSKGQIRKKKKRGKGQVASILEAKSSEDEDNRERASKFRGDRNQSLKFHGQDLNQHVRCSHHLVAPRPVSDIVSFENHSNTTPDGTTYTLPFQNVKSRATVRVIDFFPHDLADFAVPCPKPSEYDILTDAESDQDEGESVLQSQSNNGCEEERQWEWRFGLVLEDAFGRRGEEKATMEVYVAGQDAEGLLKLDAEDLRKSPEALAVLREKLFILWGDLEERKSRELTSLTQVDDNSKTPKKEEPLKSKPFQCCLKEYGIKRRKELIQEELDSGNEGCSESESTTVKERPRRPRSFVWERRWMMSGCTII